MSYNILIVDDSSIIRSVVKKTISMAGVDVGEFFEAANGVEALSLLGRKGIDVVFADINMPQMNGLDLVAHMCSRRNLAKIPVVIVSTERSQERIEQMKQQGVRAYIKKPFRPEDFRQVVQDVFGAE
ncbi:MAG TPA: response regulator [bacterium]|nr:response regulator [bacterium]